jgi:SAM-dependent methyltransferase
VSESTGGPSADYFNQWYADLAGSPAKDEILRRHLGLPDYMSSTSLLPWEAVGEVTAALRLRPGHFLLDLACGRGGYGMEIGRRSGTRLVGIDFSSEAIGQARGQADLLGRQGRFEVGDLTATGLADSSVHAVICIDAVQFARSPQAAYREIRRVLVPGGRAVLTSWEPTDRADQRVPAAIRNVDLKAGLDAAGFVEVDVVERPAWQAVERQMWQEAAGLDPGEDAALRSLRKEALRVRQVSQLLRRVMASATAGTLEVDAGPTDN